MTFEKLPIEIPEGERTPLVNWLLNLVAEQQQIIEKQQQTIEKQQQTIEKQQQTTAKLEEKVSNLDEQLKAAKKLKGKPKIRPSTLNQEENWPKKGGKTAGSDKRSKKSRFIVDEERPIEPEELPWGSTFNGYREYDVQDLIIKRHNIRFLLAENEYLEALSITSKQAIKLVTEAALLGSAIEHGVSPDLIVLSDGAKQLAILVHALCWVHMERSIRHLNGVTAQQRQEIEQVQDTLWNYYRELKAYQQQPTPQERERLERRFDEIFEQRYPHHYFFSKSP